MAFDARTWLLRAVCRPAACLAVLAMLGGCGGGGGNLQQLLTSLSGPLETGALADAAPAGPHEASMRVEGTPTGVFSQVARGTLGCWFAADGPLKAGHVYRAEAEPPAKGGHAEISIHERDGAARDLRGPRVYRIAFAAEGSGVRISTVAMKHEAKAAEAMVQDIEAWARGRESCRLGALLAPPPPPAPAAATKVSKAAKTVNGAKAAPKTLGKTTGASAGKAR